MSKLESHFQGSLDGLCGLYAISNSFDKAGVDPGAVFETAARALGKSKWPDVLFSGTTIRDMQVMLKRCSEEYGVLRASYPFLNPKSTPKTNNEYWDRFFEVTSDDDVLCCIAGVEEPSYHWIVIEPDGGRVRFTDSSHENQNFRKNVTTIHAGKRRKSNSHWRLDRSQLIVLKFCDLE